MKTNKILVLVPTPPPFSGPEVANGLLLETKAFVEGNIIHINSNVRKSNKDKGKADLKGVFFSLLLIGKVFNSLVFQRPTHFYLLLSSSRVGFIRDSIYLLLAKFVFRKKTIAHYRGSNFDGFFHSQNKGLKKYVLFIINKIDRMIIQGKAIGPSFKGLYPKEKTCVVYNGIKSKPEISRKDRDNISLLFMGNLFYPKGFYELINAYKALHTKYGNNIRLLLAGEQIKNPAIALEFLKGDDKHFYRKNHTRIQDEIDDFLAKTDEYQIEYYGPLQGEEKDKFFQKADIFVLPSYTEGFSMACLEAMAWGLPVVVTPVGALSEVIVPELNGLHTPIGNHEKLAENIDKLISSPELREKMSKQNSLEVRNKFEIEHIGEVLYKAIITT